jgi:hypothetical protein
LDNLREVFLRFLEFDLKFKPKKCELFKTRVEFHGRLVSRHGIEMGVAYISAVREWAVPFNVKEVERFPGFANYHRAFIARYAELAGPLYSETGMKPFHWGPEQQTAFEGLISALTSPPTLVMPIPNGMFVLDTDASGDTIGAELSQVQEGVERPIAYGRLSLGKDQRKYCTTRKELLSVVSFTCMYRHYLQGRRFIVRTDHHSLIWLLNFKSPRDQLARWLEELSQYNMEIQHRPGRNHANADALSRLPHTYSAADTEMAVHLKDLSCRGCQKCTKAHESWNTFTETVNDEVPLARPGTWTYSQKESPGSAGPDGSQATLYQCYPEGSVGSTGAGQDSRAALDYVTGKLLHSAGAPK